MILSYKPASFGSLYRKASVQDVPQGSLFSPLTFTCCTKLLGSVIRSHVYNFSLFIHSLPSTSHRRYPTGLKPVWSDNHYQPPYPMPNLKSCCGAWLLIAPPDPFFANIIRKIETDFRLFSDSFGCHSSNKNLQNAAAHAHFFRPGLRNAELPLGKHLPR